LYLNLFPVWSATADFCLNFLLDFGLKFQLLVQHTIRISSLHQGLIWKENDKIFSFYKKNLINIKIKITVKLIADNWGNKQQSSSYFHFCIFQRQKQTHIVSWFSVQPRNWLSDRTFLWAADVFRPKHFEAFHRLTSTHPDVRRRLVLLWIKG